MTWALPKRQVARSEVDVMEGLRRSRLGPQFFQRCRVPFDNFTLSFCIFLSKMLRTTPEQQLKKLWSKHVFQNRANIIGKCAKEKNLQMSCCKTYRMFGLSACILRSWIYFINWNISKRILNLLMKTLTLHIIVIEPSRYMSSGFLRRLKDPIRVPRIRENYHRVPKIRENRVPTDPYRVPNIFLKKTLMSMMSSQRNI